jgi:hypothetical protein
MAWVRTLRLVFARNHFSAASWIAIGIERIDIEAVGHTST